MKIIRTTACALLLLGLAGVPALAGHIGSSQKGKATAQAACQVCHGLDGVALVPEAPNLSGQQELYLQIQLKAYRAGQRRHEQMSIIARALSDDDIRNLAAWYSGIKITVKIPEE